MAVLITIPRSPRQQQSGFGGSHGVPHTRSYSREASSPRRVNVCGDWSPSISPVIGHQPSLGGAKNRERRIEPRMPDQSVTDLVDYEAGLSTDAG